jgi:hypothetical protein
VATTPDSQWVDAIGDRFGANGLGLSGVGEDGGGRGEGICLCGDSETTKRSPTKPRNGPLSSPSIRQGATQVNGPLATAVIQKVVRLNFERLRVCYADGLRRDPNLQGRVATKFVIDRSGAVSAAADGGSELPDQAVISCVVRAFQSLKFPAPGSGIVTVVYPLIFNPGD